MKTRMSPNSLEAFKQKSLDGSLKNKRALVYKCITENNYPITAKDIVEQTKIPIYTVVAHINELRYDMGLIKVQCSLENQSYYRLIKEYEEPDQRELTATEKELQEMYAFAEDSRKVIHGMTLDLNVKDEIIQQLKNEIITLNEKCKTKDSAIEEGATIIEKYEQLSLFPNK